MKNKKDRDENFNSGLKGELGEKNLKGCLIVIAFFGTIYLLGKLFNV